MTFVVIWDLDDDPDGNVHHLAEHGVSKDEAEAVLFAADSVSAVNRSGSGNEITFGYTFEGRYLAVVWEHVDEDPLTIYIVTAYDVPER
jgi:uncharacterized DUF497 family protein